MKKLVYLILILTLFSCGGPKQEDVERILEDGVDVILNHIEPYQIKEESSTFNLKEEFTIDTERDDLADKGLSDIHSFDVDSDGNVYVLCLQNNDNLILKFDNKGNFIRAFGKKGQGPGEFQMSFYFRINSHDELIVTGNRKILIFDGGGNLIKEIKVNISTSSGTLLDNGYYLFEGEPRQIDERSGKTVSYLSLYDSSFRKIKDLDRIEYPDPSLQEIEASYYLLFWRVNAQRIFTINQERGYEILVFDLNGNLLRKIRKEYKKIPPSDTFKEEYKQNLSPRMYELLKSKLSYPSSLPPFKYFLIDDKGRLIIMTYEKSTNSDEFVYDIFNPEGIFIFRKNIRSCLCSNYLYFSAVNFVNGTIKNDKFYCLSEKDSGYNELVVYKMEFVPK